MVTLYQGAVYHLYRFKKYTDVRLVFAPSGVSLRSAIRTFQYPAVDMCIFRVYGANKWQIKDYTRWGQRCACGC